MKKILCAFLCAALLFACFALGEAVDDSGGGTANALSELWRNLTRPSGSLPYHNGQVEADADMLVVNAGTSKRPVYYSAGRYAGTDKYTLDEDYTVSSDNNKAEWKYDGVGADPIYFMYVTGVGKPINEMCENLKEYYASKDEDGNSLGFTGTEKQGVNANGLKYCWLATEAQADTNYEISSTYGLELADHYVRYSYAYVETTNKFCALVAVYGKADTVEGLPSDEALFERALEFIDLISKP